MRVLRPIAIVLSLLAPSGVGAEELSYGTRFSTVYSDNVFLDQEEPRQDFSFLVEPWIELKGDEGDLTWRLRYEPSAEKFGGEEVETAWDHHLTANATWDLGPRTRLELYNRFSRTQSVDAAIRTLDATTGASNSSSDRRRFKTNVFRASLQHSLSPRHLVSAAVEHFLEDRENDQSNVNPLFSSQRGGQDSNTLRFNANYQYAIDSKNTVGLTGRVSRRTTDSSTGSSEETTTQNISGHWSHRFGEGFSLRMSAGPAWVRGSKPDPDPQLLGLQRDGTPVPPLPLRQIVQNPPGPDVVIVTPIPPGESPVFLFDIDTCPQLADGTRIFSSSATSCQRIRTPSGSDRLLTIPDAFTLASDGAWPFPVVPLFLDPQRDAVNDLSFFASAELVKEWDRLQLSLEYTRQDSTGGTFSSEIEDGLIARLEWQPAPRWRVSASATFKYRDEETDARERNTYAQAVVRVDCLVGLHPTTGNCLNARGPLPPGPPAAGFLPAGKLPPNTAVNAGFVPIPFTPEDSNDAVLDSRITLRVAYRLSQPIRLFGVLSYLDRSVIKKTTTRFEEFDRFRASVGFSYDFEPFHF